MGRTHRSIIFLTVTACCLSIAATANGAFPGANGKINFVRSPGGAMFMNSDGSGQASAPVAGIWSPDASRVLRYCNNAFCVYRADGTFEPPDYYFAAAMHGVGWSPDGTKIAFATQQCGASVCDPDRVRSQGYPAGPTVEVTAQDDQQPAWSPDGTRIAFISYRDDPRNLCLDCGPVGGSSELYVSNFDGTGQLRLTNSAGQEGPGGFALDDDVERFGLPSWSPDGTRIAVASNRDGDWEIYVVYANGSGEQRLTVNPAMDWKPVWSPDGTKIAFQTNRDGNNEIYSMTPSGGATTNLTNNAADDSLYDWLSIPVNDMTGR